MTQQYYVWVNAHDSAVSKAEKFDDETELSAAQETRPARALFLMSGDRESLTKMYELDETDFNEE